MEDLFSQDDRIQSTEEAIAVQKLAPTQSVEGDIILHNRFQVMTSVPMPQLNKGGKAFAVKDSQEQYNNLYAYISDSDLLPRTEVSELLFRRSIDQMHKIYGWSITFWPMYNKRVPVYLIEIPNGRSLAELKAENPRLWNEDQLIKHFIRPCVKLLMSLKEVNLTHRNIRLDNVFWSGEEGHECTFGECFSTAAGYMNPVYYEDINRMLCTPMLRGVAQQSADIFAMGVVIVELLATEKLPWVDMSADNFIKSRLEVGTYPLYTNKVSFSPAISELLRGVLFEVSAERWDVNAIYNWTHGKRLTPRSPYSAKKARKPIKMPAGQVCYTAREVIWYLSKDWAKSIDFYQSGVLEAWLRNDLGDNLVLDRFMTARYSQVQVKDASNKLTLAMMAMDYRNPFFLEKWIVAIDAIPTLFCMVIEHVDYEKFHHFITSDLLNIWSEYNDADASAKRMISNYNTAFAFMSRDALGFGKERVLYQLGRNIPFRGLISEYDFIPEVWYLLPALDRAMAQGYKPTTLMETHIACYICANFTRNIDDDLRKLNLLKQSLDSIKSKSAADVVKAKIVVSEAKIIAEVQGKTNNNMEFPNLCRYYVERLNDAVNLFHSRAMQRQVRKDIKELGRRGNLKEILDLIADNRRIEIDQKGFEDAVARYTKVITELNMTRKNIHNRQGLSDDLGGRYAVTISSMLSVIGVIVMFVINIF